MPRKTKRKERRNTAPVFLLLSLILAGVVFWAIASRPAHYVRRRRPVAIETPAPSPSPMATAPPATPAPATAAPSPVSSPSAIPTTAPTSAPVIANGPKLAIIIDDCGQWKRTEEALIALPIPITVAVLPYVPYTALIAREAAGAGKGVMLHLPMEPLSHINPGPGEIKTAMTDAQILRQTQDDVAQVPLAKGVNNHEGSQASADERVMKDVMGVLKDRGLFFIDSRTSAKTVAQTVAQEDGVPNSKRDVFLDNKASVEYTESMLEHAAALAKQNGSAIAIGHPKPTTYEAIRDLYPTLRAEGVQFVLAAQLVK